MNRPEIFDAWNPPGTWSHWTRPTLFSQPTRALAPRAEPTRHDASWAPPASAGVALVIDLPGRAAIDVGVALAVSRGYRPVPLHNVCTDDDEAIDQRPVLEALRDGAETLAALTLAREAAPAFLLDARRLREERVLTVGRLDNRWRVLPDDMPSAQVLAKEAITRVVVVQTAPQPSDDLAEVLAGWMQGGVTLRWRAPDHSGDDAPLTVEPSFLRRAVLWGMGPRRNSVGSFGIKIAAHS